MIVVVMGVSGSGKTSIGKRLAKTIICEFADADDFHPRANKEKMRSGVPLTDEDRLPWLQDLRKLISDHQSESKSLILACSALKQNYRRVLEGTEDESQQQSTSKQQSKVIFVWLKVDFETVQKRLKKRRHEFMNPDLLKSQFDTLEEPADAIVVDARKSIPIVVDEIIQKIR